MKKSIYCFLFVIFLSVLSYPQTSPKQELRGVWMASLGIDWPKDRGTSSSVISAQKDQLTMIFDQHKSYGINAIFFHVRPKCDAVYKSAIEPWSQYVTGTQGVAPSDPNYDPLEFAVKEAHKRGMELHAWLNPYRILATGESPNGLAPNNVLNLHPEWVIKCVNSSTSNPYQFLNPGLPEVRTYLLKVIMDIVRRYDIDGIHFDDYFYPYTDYGTFNDDATYNVYKGTFTTKAAWRMNNVNMLLAAINDSIKAVKPWVKFGISPSGNPSVNTGIYCDTPGWLQGKYTDQTGVAHSGTSYIDYIMPQLYWVSYNGQLPNWSGTSYLNGRHLYIGLPSYRYTASGFTPGELGWEMKTNRTTSTIQGEVFYNSNSLTVSNYAGCTDSLIHHFYLNSAITPKMAWLPGSTSTPNAPSNLRMEKNASTGKYELKWDAPAAAGDGKNHASFYVVYRFETAPTAEMLNDPSKILGTWGETTLPSGFAKYSATSGDYYVVTAIDRYSNESPMSNVLHYSMPDQVPQPPTMTTPVNHALILKNSAKVYQTILTWRSVPLAESYVLQVAKDSLFKRIIAYAPEHRKLTYQFNLPEPGSQYFWRVKAAGSGGSSDYSAAFEFETDTILVPTTVEPKKTESDVSIKPTFKWMKLGNAVSYQIQLSTNQYFTSNMVLDSTLTDTALTVPKSLKLYTIYYWHLRAKNSVNKQSGWSVMWPFRTVSVSGVKDDKEDKLQQAREYSLSQNYPNPFNPSTVIKYSLAKDGNVKVSVFDVLGNEVAVLVDRYQSAGTHSIEFNAEKYHLTSGLYFYTLKTNNYLSTKKMILVK
ncbi:MAG: family 10 glycosylhydrolase [Ignavibacteria bacterium]|nr:family 10 glycosylhydrolase [Ignavibacteria bacterium]MCU7504346.1 family 10 glycosylhydrolase [Ignavibacteria bacterium]MCU7517569.1 family 10 glycosylhydrolase [Ignavibacteria bacterium]